MQKIITEHMNKVCPRCGGESDAPPYKVKRYDYTCRSCFKKVKKKSRVKNREHELQYHREYNKGRDHNTLYERNRVKILARQRLRNAVKVGEITKLPCESCGDLNSQAHHPDYSKPLDVVWLCHDCHVQEHVRLGTYESTAISAGGIESQL